MKVIEVPNSLNLPRKKYVLEENEQHLLEFKPGIEVLPAQYYDSDNGGEFQYLKRHEVGEKGWKDGGHEVIDDYGLRRAFHLDALIVHPKVFKTKRKQKTYDFIQQQLGPQPEMTGEKRKRGRPALPPELRKVQEVYVPKGTKRGRPKKDPSELKTQKVYVPNGGKRGRKPLDPEVKAQREAEKAKLALLPKKGRGRPKKL